MPYPNLSNHSGAMSHCNSKTHDERELLDDRKWVNHNPVLVEEPDEDGDFGNSGSLVDKHTHHSNTLNWRHFYDKGEREAGALTRDAERARGTFPKDTEELGRMPSGIVHAGPLKGHGHNPKPTPAMTDDVIEFIFDSKSWMLHPVSTSLLCSLLSCARVRYVPLCAYMLLCVCVMGESHQCDLLIASPCGVTH